MVNRETSADFQIGIKAMAERDASPAVARLLQFPFARIKAERLEFEQKFRFVCLI